MVSTVPAESKQPSSHRMRRTGVLVLCAAFFGNGCSKTASHSVPGKDGDGGGLDSGASDVGVGIEDGSISDSSLRDTPSEVGGAGGTTVAGTGGATGTGGAGDSQLDAPTSATGSGGAAAMGGASPGGTGGGGGGGQAGQSTSHADAGAVGGTGGGDASVSIKLDVIPSWWGELDAIQELDTPLAADANCGITTSATIRQAVDVLLVLDRSSSMDYSITADCYCTTNTTNPGNLCTDTTNCTRRWNSVKPAVQKTLSSTKYVNWGLKFFPSDPTSNCGVTSTMEVPIASDTSATIQTQIDSAKPSLGTPTAAALSAATAYLKTVTDTNNKVILVATDGQPNCGGTPANINTVDMTGAFVAATAANAAGFPVYVVGIGPNLDNLTELAAAGGTKDYYPVSSPQQLADALTAIGNKVGSCSFKAYDMPPDPNNFAVYVNKQKVDQGAADGWTYDASSQSIVLTGSNCDDVNAGKDTTVQILFGCPGGPPFPSSLP